ncbi:cobaltochelatase, CobN subunit [Thalassoporum mexicanum PCC 7367]|uniref:cobaltochelatase subunit CobN n=1 Tax=Thalassoporum mexicanum TaxID=3457544 RepID=UPI00029FD2E4|nr:cobaltochelatase subunit CobN [Pseudanabaena sp. PCC 7367]AFY70952.1 cobaltochelatase, CobN subunit [Pseudanabaena sp. PCC 7367]
MHRLAATPGGWSPDREGVIFIEQSPAPIVILTAADTDIQTLAIAAEQLPDNFPEFRVANLLNLQQELTIDTYADDVLSQAQVVVLRLLGGRSYWSYGLEVCKLWVEEYSNQGSDFKNGQKSSESSEQLTRKLIVLPGDNQFDLDLVDHSNVSLQVAERSWRYFLNGGVDNIKAGLLYISDACLGTNYQPESPQPIANIGLYNYSNSIQGQVQNLSADQSQNPALDRSPGSPQSLSSSLNQNQIIEESIEQISDRLFLRSDRHTQSQPNQKKYIGRAGILFYRAHYLAGNLAPINALCAALIQRRIEPVPVYIYSLQDPHLAAELDYYFNGNQFNGNQSEQLEQSHESGQPHRSQRSQRSNQSQQSNQSEGKAIDILLNTTSFSLIKPNKLDRQVNFELDQSEPDKGAIWRSLNVPILQVILAGCSKEQWQTQSIGLTPRDLAMNVVLPEVDGRIITRAISFKTALPTNQKLETNVVVYEPVRDRVEFVTDLAANWLKLRKTAVGDRKVALILANYPTRNGRLANGVGLDTPASCINILHALQINGYGVGDIPADGDRLIELLTNGATNDPESEANPVYQSLAASDYCKYFEQLPRSLREKVIKRWGEPPEDRSIKVSGIQLGHIFIGIQPARGYDQDPSLNYHSPDLEPPHEYFAFYFWLRHVFGINAIVHVGKHGNLEWLPGKAIALSKHCFPEAILGPMPHLYPFIVNDPGEGTQAKRRAQAVIIDHLTPPMTRAETYGGLLKLEHLIDEYYQAQTLDPPRLPTIQAQIAKLIEQENLNYDLDLMVNAGDTNNAEVASPVNGINNLNSKNKNATASDQSRHSDRQFSQLTQTISPAAIKTNPVDQASKAAWLEIINQVDGYICELKEAQIRDGLHIFGQCPQGNQLRDLIVAIARNLGGTIANSSLAQDNQDIKKPDIGNGSGEKIPAGLTRAIAQKFNLDFDPLGADLAQPYSDLPRQLQAYLEPIDQNVALNFDPIDINNSIDPDSYYVNHDPASSDRKVSYDRIAEISNSHNSHLEPDNSSASTPDHLFKPSKQCRTIGQAIAAIENYAADLVTQFLNQELVDHHYAYDLIARIYELLQQSDREITNLLRGLNGEYVASGASGAPTRGRLDALPTGKNFYSVDIRSLPTESAWDIGRRSAEILLETYCQEHGEYPQSLGLSVWGTATMRTGGDDIAEALALIGVQPVWDGISRRVVDFQVIPLSLLDRPRIDVTLRISGFFRDGFANLIDLFQRAVETVAQLDEPAELNPIKARITSDRQNFEQQGISTVEAAAMATYRVFGSKPGAYGAGLQGLIESQNWQNDADLARAYINWSSYAYSGYGEAHAAASAFKQRLGQMQIVLHNQDNREHDLLDSDDYYQFQGGMIAAVRSLRGKNPQAYFGDHAQPEHPQVRKLSAEIARVYRSRVVNPKWLKGVMRHGYKGAFELAATVDYLFAYDATANCVSDFMYAGIAQTYLLDRQVQQFVNDKNPWALRDMAERLLEAHQRQLWQEPDPTTLQELRSLVLSSEAQIEMRTNPN